MDIDKAFNEAWPEIQKHGHERGWLGVAEAAWQAAIASQDTAPPAAVPAPDQKESPDSCSHPVRGAQQDAVSVSSAGIVAPAQAVDALHLIYYDDRDRNPEVILGGATAEARFKQISGQWNAHLFVKLKSNSRDDRYYSANAALAAQPAAPATVKESLPVAPAGEPVAVNGVRWDLFPGYLIDNCEGDMISEEQLQGTVAAMLKHPDYLAAIAATVANAGQAQPKGDGITDNTEAIKRAGYLLPQQVAKGEERNHASVCCNQNCNQGRDCPQRTPAISATSEVKKK